MGEYRNRTTGEVKSQGQWRSANSNMSLPRAWSSATLDALDVDPVLASPAATTTAYELSVRDGVKQDANGNWVENYVAQDMFFDTTDEDGVTTTKAQHKTAYQAGLDAAASESNRTQRDALIAATDFYALSDVTMSDAMTVYRQSLRDISTHSDWPNLSDDDWPVAP
tara:strand:+ start:1327 stop:1827 length:501 start_codon:yes stop_codon:yes gene_type:complete